jgi:alpha-tubulin suppressor-like RCC1 family protein
MRKSEVYVEFCFGIKESEDYMNLRSSKTVKLLLTILLAFSVMPWAAPLGGTVSAALVENVYAFGEGDGGRLGLSETDFSDRMTPAVVSSLTGLEIEAVSAGFDYTLILTTDGDVYSFGNGANGRLGHGDTLSQPLPKKIEALDDLLPDEDNDFVVAISAGVGDYTSKNAHSLLLTNQGRVFAFGSGTSGQLGQGSDSDLLSPTEIMGVPSVRAISAGGLHSLLLTYGGEIYSFGSSNNGRLGRDDTDTPYNLPGYIELEDELWLDVVAISAGNNFSLALTRDENPNDGFEVATEVFAFGAGNLGQLGLGTGITSKAVPTVIPGLNFIDVTAISAGYDYGLVLTQEGDVYSFGDNYAGRLGHGDDVTRNVPEQIMALDNESVKAISAGAHSIVLTEEGEAYSFGDGMYGQLGTGVNNEKKVPTKVVGLSNVTHISAGFYHTVLNGAVDDSLTYSVSLSVSNPHQFYPLLLGYASSLAQTVNVTNTGTGDITGLTVTIDGTDASSFEFVGSPASPVIAPGASTPFYVRPKLGLTAGDYEAAVTVTANNGISQSFDVRATVTATPTYTIDVTPSELIFPVRTVGYSALSGSNVTVARTGTGDIRNMSVTLEGENPDSFLLGTIASGELLLSSSIKSFNLTVRPKQGLTFGTHDAIIRIRGDNGVDESVSLSFTVNGTKPATPSLIPSDAQIRVNWTPVVGATGYNIYVGTAPGSYGAPVPVGNSSTSYDLTELTNGTPYYIAISAFNDTVETPISDEASATPQVAAPGAPVIQSATAGNTTVDLT